MRWAGATLAAMLSVATACGLSESGLSDSTGASDAATDAGSEDAAHDATVDGPSGFDGSVTGEGASPIDAATDAAPTPDGSAACASSPSSCGAPGACMSCAASPQGHACVANGAAQACGCATTEDCPPLTACNGATHACTSACAGGLVCARGCCDGAQCQAGSGNGACGPVGGTCSACSGTTPTCSNTSTCTGACGGANDGTCGGASCCRNGECAATGDTACGPQGGTCVDCTNAPTGDKCMLLNNAFACGCGGPASPTDCPQGNSCRNNQCATTCDGQHPCNGGCCSLDTNGACVAACNAPMTCTANYCQ